MRVSCPQPREGRVQELAHSATASAGRSAAWYRQPKNVVSSGRIWVTSARIACTSAGVAADRGPAEQDDLGGFQVMRSRGLAASSPSSAA